MKAVYRKEMRQYFHSVIGYVFLAIFVFINAFYFLLQNLLTRSGDITDYFRATITLEMFLMPMLTMRSFSEEKKQKTDLLLYTVPVDCSQVVLAKFLAAETLRPYQRRGRYQNRKGAGLPAQRRVTKNPL